MRIFPSKKKKEKTNKQNRIYRRKCRQHYAPHSTTNYSDNAKVECGYFGLTKQTFC